uniref:Uncharacterized protein n=1 Tax=Branchiostoma floridae TaxID=7739 RepID=C3YH77_BRAFL|eukprot:XP_002604302.1 hypothetical protein BRAFLDRAFT_88591 [Branchiostoma floridae]
MAGSHTHPLTLPFATTFDTVQMRPELTWLNEPQDFMLRADGTNGILVTPKEKSDFWRKTYYTPELINDNGHLLYAPVTDTNCVMETLFEVSAANQFDQAGLMVRYDHEHWLKTVENKAHDEDRWDFIRILHLEPPVPTSDPQVAMMGPMVCAPTASGGTALFHKFNVRHSDGYLQYHHN